MPTGTDVLYHSDMVTLEALLSQHSPKTEAYTSIKAQFMISVLLPHSSPALSLILFYSVLVCPKCECAAFKGNY